MNRMRRGIGLALLLSSFVLSPYRANAEELISIDANHRYEGMETSFSKGYAPSVRKDQMRLVIPFLSDAPLAQEAMTVGVAFEPSESSPFVYKNYQKRVKKSKKGVYLFRCPIQLKKNRVNGQYPLRVYVLAKTAQEVIRQEFTLYIEITDGRAKLMEEVGDPYGEVPREAAPVGLEEEASDEKEEATHQPRILICENSVQGGALSAGEQKAWALSAKNCSVSQPVENVKVTLLSGQSEVAFEKNAWYFERIAAGGQMELSQTITVSQKAAGNAAAQLQFEYEDGKGNAYSSTETVFFSICQKQEARLTHISFPEGVYESDTAALSFQVVNTGLAVIYNARVRIEGRGLFPEKEAFLGNLEGGASQEGEIAVFVGNLAMDADGNLDEADEKYGGTTGNVIFSYENEQGEVTEQSQEFASAIRKPKVIELDIEKEEPQTNQWWVAALALSMLALILLAVGLYLRMSHYRKLYRG